jgi:hypothetical protein
MQNVIIVSPEIIRKALEETRKFSEAANTGELLSLREDFQSAVGRIWDQLSATIKKAQVWGSEKVQDAVNDIINVAEDLLEQAKDMAAEVHNNLIVLLRTFLKKLIDSAMTLIPTSIAVGNSLFSVSKINYSQKLILGGSLKFNILEIISITSTGEMQLSIEYSKPATA